MHVNLKSYMDMWVSLRCGLWLKIGFRLQNRKNDPENLNTTRQLKEDCLIKDTFGCTISCMCLKIILRNSHIVLDVISSIWSGAVFQLQHNKRSWANPDMHVLLSIIYEGRYGCFVSCVFWGSTLHLLKLCLVTLTKQFAMFLRFLT